MLIRDALSKHFGPPIQSMTFLDYLTYLNSAGKISQRSLLELLIILCEQIEEQERREEQYRKNFKDIEDILVQLLKNSGTASDIPPEAPVVPSEELPATTEPVLFACEVCGKKLSTKLSLSGHKRSHK